MPSSKCRMLVVGDENPELIAELLTRHGVEARAAREVRFALSDLLDDAPFGPHAPPNAIMINVKTDREALVRSFKENQATSRLPILVLSTDASDQHRLAMYEAGASLFLLKRADPEKLEQDLASLVEFWCGLVLPPPARQPAPV